MSSNNDRPSESLQVFLAGLAGLNTTEIRKAKELYLRNEIAEYHAEIRSTKNGYFTMALHLLIPMFWPMIFGGQRERKIRLQEKRTKIENALHIWKDDLMGSHGELKSLLNSTES